MQLLSFGDWLRRRRKALDLTQAELADQVGCSAAAIRKIEAEERRPSLQIAERLADIFAIPAMERTNFLHFARGERRVGPAETEEDLPWTISTKSTRTNLPATVTSFIGREQEIALVREYLLDPNIRLVTLIGPPGIGKTRLSIEAARTVLSDFPDGVFFVSLAPLDDSSLIPQTIAQSLGHIETKNISISEQLKEGIGIKNLLIVLDNCEHLIEEISALASDLLLACSGLKLLATSRESLRISGEWLYVVPGLNAPAGDSAADRQTASEFPALALFAERARAVRSDFILDDDNLPLVTSICAQLDGLPLAIELIAARMRLMTPSALLEHLNNQFVLSADGMRTTSTRQKTLNDAIAWSYNLLSEEEQSLFAYLSVFSDRFTLEAVESIFSEMFVGTSISSLLTSLLDKSLLQRTFDQEPHRDIHSRMLVTVRNFALNRLQRMGKEADTRNKHLAYFCKLAEKANKEIRGPNQVEWFHRLKVMRDNLRTALGWAIETQQTEAALQMASHFSLFWFRCSDLSEGRQWLEQVLALPDASHYAGLYTYTLAQLALGTWQQIGAEKARPFIDQALSLARAHNDEWNSAWARIVLGLVLIYEGNFVAAQASLEESKALFRQIQDEWGYAGAVLALALGAYNQNSLVTSLALHEEALVAFRQLGDKYFENVALRFIGILQVRLGNLTPGVAALRESLILARSIDSKYEIAASLQCIADAAQADGNLTRAVYLHWAARNIFDSIGAWQQENATNFENMLAPYQTALGISAFTTAMEEGRILTIEQAITYALEWSTGSRT